MSGHVGKNGWKRRVGAVFQEDVSRGSVQRVLAAGFWTEPGEPNATASMAAVLSLAAHPRFGPDPNPQS